MTQTMEMTETPGEVARYSYGKWYNFGTLVNGFGRTPHRLVKDFRTVAPVVPRMKILDFGCGTGRLSRAFLKTQPNLSITGVEPSESMAKVYRDDMAVRPQCTLIQGGINGDLSFAGDASYDAVASAGVFDHIDFRTGSALSNLLRVVKPGGHLAFTYERNPDESVDYELRRSIYHRYSEGVMADFVKAAGAEILCMDRMIGFLRTTGAGMPNWRDVLKLKETPDLKLPQLAHYGIIVAQKPAI